MKTSTVSKVIPAGCASTRLERNALRWLNSRGGGYSNGWVGAYADLQHGGCISGMVGHLIYSADCRKFLKYHREEINTLLAEQLSDCGFTSPAELLRDWDAEDPLGMNTNVDWLAWFGFEMAARTVAERAGGVE